MSFYGRLENKEVNNSAVAHNIGATICDYLGREYQTVFGVHENTEQLYIHFAMNSASYLDGHRHRGTRKEFYDMKKKINSVLKNYDILPVRYISNKNSN